MSKILYVESELVDEFLADRVTVDEDFDSLEDETFLLIDGQFNPLFEASHAL